MYEHVHLCRCGGVRCELPLDVAVHARVCHQICDDTRRNTTRRRIVSTFLHLPFAVAVAVAMPSPPTPPPPPPPPSTTQSAHHHHRTLPAQPAPTALPTPLAAETLPPALAAEFSRFTLEQWYPLLGAQTPRSTLLPLNTATAQLLLSAHEGARACSDERVVDLSPLNDAEATLRTALLPELSAQLDAFGAAGAFVKSAGRSPKDAVLRSGRLRASYEAALLAHVGDGAALAGLSPNDRLGLFLFAGGEALRHTPGDGARLLRLLILSERVADDLRIAQKQGTAPTLVFRQWVPTRVDAEFRLFVQDGTLTGITQYLHTYFSPLLVSKQAAVRTALSAYFEQELAPLLSPTYDTYALDVAIADFGPDEATWQPHVLEINPFFEATGDGLFADAAGQDIIHGQAGVEYPVMRVQERAQGLTVMDRKWRDMMTAAEAAVRARLEANSAGSGG